MYSFEPPACQPFHKLYALLHRGVKKYPDACKEDATRPARPPSPKHRLNKTLCAISQINFVLDAIYNLASKAGSDYRGTDS